MTVPLENITGSAKSNQMVGGHQGLGMVSNLLNRRRKDKFKMALAQAKAGRKMTP